eukprot:UN0293
MTQFLKDRASDSEEVVTPLMPDGTYLSRNSATLGPMIRQPPCDFFFSSACNSQGKAVDKFPIPILLSDSQGP